MAHQAKIRIECTSMLTRHRTPNKKQEQYAASLLIFFFFSREKETLYTNFSITAPEFLKIYPAKKISAWLSYFACSLADALYCPVMYHTPARKHGQINRYEVHKTMNCLC